MQAPPETSRRALGAAWTLAALGLVSAALLRARPLSMWLRAFTPDGTFQPATAGFLDSMWLVALAVGLVSLALALDRGLRRACAAALSPRDASETSRAGLWIPILAACAGILRLVVARFSDIGLGDDGARVIWLEQWLHAPHFVTTGLWAPGHLYLMAVVWVVIRDAVRAGVLLSALASAGTVWILARGIERNWGRAAGICAAVCVAVLPVSVAHGATPDVNPVFAFLMLAAVAAVLRFTRQGARVWLFLAWLCMAFAAWSRFEAFLLVPGLALLLWPRWRTLLLFGAACLVPTAAWHVMALLSNQTPVNVVSVVRHETSLHGSRISTLFSYMGGFWQGVTLPFLACGALGMLSALRARRGREWMPILLLHVGALTAALVVANTGTQARYLILAASILAAYSGAFLGAIFESSRAHGLAALACVALLLAVTPQMYPGGKDLWIRRDLRLHHVVDQVVTLCSHSKVPGHPIGEEACDVVWVSDESPFFYACRVHPPVGRYHAISRGDDDPVRLLEGLRARDRAIAVVRESSWAMEQWSKLERAAAAEWSIGLETNGNGYKIFDLTRQSPRP